MLVNVLSLKGEDDLTEIDEDQDGGCLLELGEEGLEVIAVEGVVLMSLGRRDESMRLGEGQTFSRRDVCRGLMPWA